jgi:hypothetical protein
MSSWSQDALNMIADNEDFYVSPHREDGSTYAPRRRRGRSSSMVMSMCAPPTDRSRGGTRRPSARRPVECWSPERSTRSPSNPSAARSTGRSTPPTRRSTRAARPCRSCRATDRSRRPSASPPAKRSIGAPAVAPVDEPADDQHDGREAEGGVSVSGSTVGVAAELAVVRPPRVGRLDDPSQPEP